MYYSESSVQGQSILSSVLGKVAKANIINPAIVKLIKGGEPMGNDMYTQNSREPIKNLAFHPFAGKQ